MSPKADQVLIDALKLSPIERAELIERLLASFPFPERQAIDERWAAEVEGRIDAYERGALQARPMSEVFERIERGGIE